MRSYTVAIASLAIHAPLKWTDNIISQHAVPGVVSARRGVARRIPHHTLIRLAIVRQLHAELGLGVADALRIAAEIVDNPDASGVFVCGQIELSVDRPALERLLQARMRDALESAPAPRRGRPARRPKT